MHCFTALAEDKSKYSNVHSTTVLHQTCKVYLTTPIPTPHPQI